MIHDVALKPREDVREHMLRDEPEIAKPKLRELILIIRRAKERSEHLVRPLTMQVKLSAERVVKVRELKQLLGVSSQDAVIQKCIDIIYDQKTPLKVK